MRPSKDEYMMLLARVAATRTTCIKRAVGCVLADARGHVLSVGYNGVASGVQHCNEAVNAPVYHDDPRVTKDANSRSWLFKGRLVPMLSSISPGSGNQQCVGFDVTTPHACKDHDLPPGLDCCEAVHAETNAMLQCRDPWAIETAYVTLSPCKACLKMLLNTGCRRIYFLEEHDDPWPKEQWTKVGRFWSRLKSDHPNLL